MNNQLNLQSQKPKNSFWKIVALGGLSAGVLCILCIGSVVFILWGGGEPATLAVPIKVDQEFIQSIHDNKIDNAYLMLSEKFIPKLSKEQFNALIQRDRKIFSTYKKLDICDWGFFISDGQVITSSGLLSYENGEIVVEISLHKDADSIWRVQGFKFRPDVAPKSFGLCK